MISKNNGRKSAVVFGGSGFLGSYVVEELVERGWWVRIADLNSPHEELKFGDYVFCDLNNKDSLAEVIPVETDVVYNYAGMSDLDEALNKPLLTMELNILGNLHILETCRKQKVRHFVYASSAYACSESGSFYGISKLSSEKIVEEYQNRYGLDYTIIRYGSLYGERADHRNGVYRLLRQALEKGEILHRGDGEEVREYIHAIDAAKLSADILMSKEFQNQHVMITGLELLKQKNLLKMIQEMCPNQISVKMTEKHYTGHYEVTPYSFRPTVARKLVANPFIDLGQGLVECMLRIHQELHSDNEA
jgi:UDP-glucose 4-epimerase